MLRSAGAVSAPTQDHKPGVVVLDGIDLGGDDFQAEEPGGQLACNSGGMPHALLAHLPGGEGGIFGLDETPPFVVQIIGALQQGHRMGPHFADLAQLDVGQHEQVLPNLQIELADDAQQTILQQAVIGQNAPGDRVLDSHQGCIGAPLFQGSHHVPKGGAGNDLYLFAEVSFGGDVVETAFVSLYRYAQSHINRSLLV